MKIKAYLHPLSLSLRLVGFISATAIAAFLTFSMIMIYSVDRHFAEQDIQDLKKINATIGNLLTNHGDDLNTRIAKIDSFARQQGNISVYIENAQREVIWASPDGPDFAPILQRFPATGTLITDTAGATEQHTDSLTHQNSRYRVMVSPLEATKGLHPAAYTLAIAMSTDFHSHYIQSLKSDLAIAAAIICTIIILMVLLAVYQGHAPLRRVSRQIASITSENLNVRLQPEEVPVELRQLATSFNVMLGKIEDVFQRQSHFSADIAHEMRTPITNLITQNQFILNHPRSIEEYQELLYSNQEEYDRIAKMVGDMLFLSQADNNLLATQKTPINLTDEVMKVVEFFEAWAEDKGIDLHLTGGATPIQGDPAMLRRVINNLLSNAIRYTQPGKTITIRLAEHADSVSLTVSNPGEPIPAESLPHLFDRFYRVDQSRQRKSEGSGIGLAIVKSIIEAHQGHVAVQSNSQSTDFTVLLPKH